LGSELVGSRFSRSGRCVVVGLFYIRYYQQVFAHI
jgi:hypothetical protein